MNDSKQAVRDFWQAEACGERYGDEQDRLRYELEPEILSFADFASARGLRVLEIGVGMGADYVRWLEAGAMAVGVDLTTRAAAMTSDRVTRRGRSPALAVADAERLPFPDEAFHIVYSWGVLHHTADTVQALREARRLLAPGGRLKTMIYHRHSWVALAAWARYCLLRGRPWQSLAAGVGHVESPGTKAYTESEARELVVGMEAVRIRPVLTHWDRRLAPGVAARLGDRFGWFLLIEATKPA